jgi:hypothetical protein
MATRKRLADAISEDSAIVGSAEKADDLYPDSSKQPSQAQAARSQFGQSPVDDDANNEQQIALGNELAVRFLEEGIHPVLLFGSAASGKTSLLMSLLNYPRLDSAAEASIEYDESIYTEENRDKFQQALDAGMQLFYRGTQQWVANLAPRATTDNQPFFLPVRLQKSIGQDIKFGFLEGKGEWYHPDDTSLRPYRKFKGLLRGFLQNFSRPITALYIAPFESGTKSLGGGSSGNLDYLRTSDLGLVGAMEEYITCRRSQFKNDFHVMLMTKWDVKCGSVSSAEFKAPIAEDVVEELVAKFPLAWNRFNAMPMDGSAENLKIAAYSSGLMDGGRLNQLAVDDKYFLNTYPRFLWDRLHGNAGFGVLYKDVQLKRTSVLDRLLAFLRS